MVRGRSGWGYGMYEGSRGAGCITGLIDVVPYTFFIFFG